MTYQNYGPLNCPYILHRLQNFLVALTQIVLTLLSPTKKNRHLENWKIAFLLYSKTWAKILQVWKLAVNEITAQQTCCFILLFLFPFVTCIIVFGKCFLTSEISGIYFINEHNVNNWYQSSWKFRLCNCLEYGSW